MRSEYGRRGAGNGARGGGDGGGIDKKLGNIANIDNIDTFFKTMYDNNYLLSWNALLTILCIFTSKFNVEAFLVARVETNVCPTRHWCATSRSTAFQDPDDMRLREIQSELKQRKVTYDDCFDRESLMKRLFEAREHQAAEDGESQTEATDPSPSIIPERHEVQTSSDEVLQSFDREATLLKLRGERIKTLREKLSHHNVRWGSMIEKEELVKALCDAMEDRFARSQNFSRSGEVIIGEVCDSEEGALRKELGWLESDLSKGVITPVPEDSKPTSYAPILLDVYATW